MKNKSLDWGRRIDIAVAEPRVLDPAVLADQRATRSYLMRACLECRRYLGLEVPEAEAAGGGATEGNGSPKRPGPDAHQIDPQESGI